MEISRIKELLVLAILTWVFLKLLVRSLPRHSAPIATSPWTWFSHLRPKYLGPRQETPTARDEVEGLDQTTDRLLLLQHLPFFDCDADVFGGSLGPGPQPMRGMSGFPAQQQAQARNATLASARLPNGKLGAIPSGRYSLEWSTELHMLTTEDE